MAQASTKTLSNGGIAFFSSLCISTFGLGFWQTQRYFEKKEMVLRRKEELAMSPIMNLERNPTCSTKEIIGSKLGDTNITSLDNPSVSNKRDYGYTRICIEGLFRHQDEILVGPRGPPPGAISASGPNSGRSSGGMSSSPQGYFVITPLIRTNDMGTVLVNRGWVPMQYVKQKIEWDRPSGTVSIVGVPSRTEQPRFMSPPHNPKTPSQLLWMDRVAIEDKTKTTGISPLLLTETSTSTSVDVNEVSFPVRPSKEAVGEFTVSPATHAGYAFTWFGLSGAGIFMTKKLISRGRS